MQIDLGRRAADVALDYRQNQSLHNMKYPCVPKQSMCCHRTVDQLLIKLFDSTGWFVDI